MYFALFAPPVEYFVGVVQFFETIDLTNFENAFKYLVFTSSLAGDQDPPLTIICFIKELL